MHKRQRSNVNSSLFMQDPVPARESKKTPKTEEKFYVKGDDDADTLLVKNQEGSYQVHRNHLRETLKELKIHHNKAVKDLDPASTDLFRSVVEAVRLLYGSQSIYDLVLKDIHSVFSDIKSVAPGTVAAFFVGCFSDDKFPGPVGCSPKCASSLPPTEGTPGYASCEDLVLVYSKGAFHSLNEKRTEHCYIYVEDSDFKEFSEANIRQLKDAGVVSVTLIFGNEKGDYKEVKDKLEIGNLPMIAPTSAPVKTSQSTTNNVINVLFAILIIIILLFLIIFFIRKLSK